MKRLKPLDQFMSNYHLQKTLDTGAMLMASMFAVAAQAQQKDADEQVQDSPNIRHSAFIIRNSLPTGLTSNVLFVAPYRVESDAFELSVKETYAHLMTNAKELGADIESVLFNNLSRLYEE